MAHGEGNHGHRHPDAVAYLEGLGEEGAAVVRPYDGGHTRYWLEDGEVRSLDIAGDGPLPALLEAVSAEFGPRMPKLAADLASGAPDLDGPFIPHVSTRAIHFRLGLASTSQMLQR